MAYCSIYTKSLIKPLKSEQVSILSQLYNGVTFKIFDNMCYKQSLMVDKIKLLNTQYQYPYPRNYVWSPDVCLIQLKTSQFQFTEQDEDISFPSQKEIICLMQDVRKFVHKSYVLNISMAQAWQAMNYNFKKQAAQREGDKLAS